MVPPRTSTRRRRSTRFFWEDLPQDELLDVRMCDLKVKIQGTWLEGQVDRLHEELLAQGLDFRVRVWLSDEWFSSMKVPGVAIPFYLAHPRLKRLERNQMLEVEGGTRKECMMLLRHETGHAVQSSFQLHRRKSWREHFGRSSLPYPDYYRPNPASKRFVQHLDACYAQCHPDEDFAETFAVWLRPRSNWRQNYRGWPAVRKLRYVDELMKEIAGEKPKLRSRAQVDSLPTIQKTLREHYLQKRERYTVGNTTDYDEDLEELFTRRSGRRSAGSAAGFLRRHRKEIRELVAKWTGEYRFTLDQVLKDFILRCRELKLIARGSERELKMDVAILLTVRTMRYLYRNREWHVV